MAEPTPTLSASVIMPTYNKARYLDLTLASFLHQTSRDYEIVITDDGSTDATQDVIARYQGRLNLRYLRQANRGRAAARNAAIQQARGDILIFSDDDRIVSPDFVAEHVKAFSSDSDRMLVLGWQYGMLTWWSRGLDIWHRLHPFFIESPELARKLLEHEELQLVTAEDVEHQYEQVVGTFGLLEPWWEGRVMPTIKAFSEDLSPFHLCWSLGTTGNMSVTRKRVVEVGMFDEAFSNWGLEDTELSFRLVHSGHRTVVRREAANFHQVHMNSPTRLNEWHENYRYFASKHDSIQLSLYALLLQRKLTPVEANRLADECQALLREGRTLLVDELKRLYRTLLSVDSALSPPTWPSPAPISGIARPLKLMKAREEPARAKVQAG
ncbi:glycosyltransferase family 2 protein [Archangium lipolyticum]|uniref:glycosyltransferase family 2 protein n=1 Tax=Archangium lipolyticum TaxID=2970465 RepID=UPI00214A799F|nr:glycosyltransferase family 2 protein [Archangium lipolyticum]